MKQTSTNSTRTMLIQAAETLFAEKGFDNVTVREIVRTAGQKNESALSYHFKNRDGLIATIQASRGEQLESRRADIVRAFLETTPEPDLRDLCALLLQTPFTLCSEDKTFKQYLAVFGQRLIASGQPITTALGQQKSDSIKLIHRMMRNALSGMDDQIFSMRFEAVSGFVLLSMSRRARERASFKGKSADLFINNLADLMAAMLSAPVSAETNVILESQ